MNVVESVRMSWRAITGHRLRSVLTVLGVVIGVGSVITFVTLGASLQAAIVGDVATSSPDIAATVGPADGPEGGPGSTESIPVFTEHDIEQLQGIDGVDAVIPTGQVGIAGLEFRDDRIRWPAVTATTAASFDEDEFAAGGPFTAGTNETVLNPAAARMFEENVSAGDEITVEFAENDSRTLTVAGVLNESTGFAAVGGGGGTPAIYVPTDPFYTTTAESPTTGERERAYPQLTVRAASYEQVGAVETPARAYLQNESDASQLKPASYEISLTTNDALVEQIQSILSTFTNFITGIAVISLLVGAIGIANMMLVSVTERTREIGIMKAVGATRRDVVQLFLVESIILGVIGSVLGTLVGLAGGYAAAQLIDLPVSFAPEWFAIAIAVGVGVGIVSGIYPAWDAARTDPIDALRHE
ncbi:macrolide transporter ATP-binding /permease protein [Halolamina pelagica]|uniref:Macrolide transporter ATP-binding /permease protein n=1 Tax=Halolamina pelagica TaxID=699431 RepID=A0A0P7HE99_9EURY|nr:ABC transporter permease [Halolamina pelagica]KPN32005.1 macrolide transporter ATP-binding /permease protein [Halolamina pelagica]